MGRKTIHNKYGQEQYLEEKCDVLGIGTCDDITKNDAKPPFHSMRILTSHPNAKDVQFPGP